MTELSKKERDAILVELSETPAERFQLPQAYGDPAFIRCVMEAIETPELVEQFDRLKNTRLSKMGTLSPINQMVDKATGFQDDQMRTFSEFVHDLVYLRLPHAAIHALRISELGGTVAAET